MHIDSDSGSEPATDSGTDSATDVVELREVAVHLAAEAAAFVRRRRAEVFGPGAPIGSPQDDEPAVRMKSTPTDPVTVVDTATERLLRERLAVLRPADAILGEEEGGPVDTTPGRLTWALDPIDGTVNFVYGIPTYAVSVGVRRDGVTVAGAVADVAWGEVYSAALGHGATVGRDGVVLPLRCSSASELSMALVGTGFSYDREQRRRQGRIVADLLPEVRDLRRIGSCALDLCMVAAGRLDAYFEDGVHLWDWAAGALIATEAGATVRLPDAPDGSGLIVAAAAGVSAALDAALDDALARVGVPDR